MNCVVFVASQNYTSTGKPVIPTWGGECPFGTSHAKFGLENLNIVHSSDVISDNSEFRSTVYNAHLVLYGKINGYSTSNKTIWASRCNDGTMKTCAIDVAAHDPESGISAVNPVTKLYPVMIPIHFYELEISCILKKQYRHGVHASLSPVLPARILKTNLTLSSTCDFPILKPGNDVIVTVNWFKYSRHLHVDPSYIFSLKKAFNATAENIKQAKDLCGFDKPEIPLDAPFDHYNQKILYCPTQPNVPSDGAYKCSTPYSRAVLSCVASLWMVLITLLITKITV